MVVKKKPRHDLQTRAGGYPNITAWSGENRHALLLTRECGKVIIAVEQTTD